jgi:hypothetical protein
MKNIVHIPTLTRIGLSLLWGAVTLQAQSFQDFHQAQDIREVSAPEVAPSSEFLYRVQSQGGLRYYKVTMTAPLYESKRTFLWPPSLPKSTIRASLLLFGADEIVFNDSLILSDADAIFFQSDTGLVPLVKVPRPGIVYLRSQDPASILLMDPRTTPKSFPVPLYLYTINDSTRIGLIRTPSHLPMEFNPYTPMGTFRIHMVTADSLPRLVLLPRYLNDEPPSTFLDSTYLQWLDKTIASLTAGLAEDSAQVAHFLGNLHTVFPPALAQQTFEETSTFLERRRIHDAEMLELAKQVFLYNDFGKVLQPLREKVVFLQKQRAEVLEECKRQSDPKYSWLNQHFWNHPLLVASGMAGRHLPDWASHPGPGGLWGARVLVSSSTRIFRLTALEYGLDASYSQWKFNQDENLTSQSIAGSARLTLAIPLWQRPSGNVALLFHPGLVGGYHFSTIREPLGTFHYWGPGFGGVAQVSLLFSHLPLHLSLEYRYTSDQLGDLSLGIGIPLWKHGGAP